MIGGFSRVRGPPTIFSFFVWSVPAEMHVPFTRGSVGPGFYDVDLFSELLSTVLNQLHAKVKKTFI